MAQLPRKASGPRPEYFEDPAIDKVLSMALALAGEVAVMRDRIDTLERDLYRAATGRRNSYRHLSRQLRLLQALRATQVPDRTRGQRPVVHVRAGTDFR